MNVSIPVKIFNPVNAMNILDMCVHCVSVIFNNLKIKKIKIFIQQCWIIFKKVSKIKQKDSMKVKFLCQYLNLNIVLDHEFEYEE